MKEDSYLVEYGIESGNTLHMLLQLKGGCDEQDWEDKFQKKRTWKYKLTIAKNNYLMEMSDLKNENVKREKYEEEYEDVIQNFSDLISIGKRLNKSDEFERLQRSWRNWTKIIKALVNC